MRPFQKKSIYSIILQSGGVILGRCALLGMYILIMPASVLFKGSVLFGFERRQTLRFCPVMCSHSRVQRRLGCEVQEVARSGAHSMPVLRH
eukprot:5834623-Amphidinium_carterae.1